MSLEIIGISVLWTFLFGYVILGSIDFGAGFFNGYTIITGKHHTVSKIIERYLSPVWEVTMYFSYSSLLGLLDSFRKQLSIMERFFSFQSVSH